ncbi:MAG: hypothetical protein IJ730_00120 [Alphaproteobacteria bacterium]|nr:hypothetical protein [Alphaproteobacteria bacterium]
MFKQLLCCSIFCALIFSYATADAKIEKKNEAKTEEENHNEDSLFSIGDENAYGFLNLKAAHERSNTYAFGPKNASAIAMNPVISLGDFTIDADLYYGRQFSYSSVLNSERNLVRTVSSGLLKEFHDSSKQIKAIYAKAMDKNVNKPYFYRQYTRLLYNNDENNFRVVLGDTTTRNQIGYQQAVSGAGISIFRQSGNGSVINSSNPIVITRPSKVECKLGDDILVTRLFAPGTYYLDDLPEEAKIPGVTLKITDQINRSEVFVVDYFSGYGMLKEGEDDFDLSVIYASRYNVDDPMRVKYANDPNFSGNYRRGLTDVITVGAAAQVYKSSYTVDATAIFGTEYGKISPNIAFSKDTKHDNALAAGIYYAIPANEYGVMFETFLGVKEKGYSDLRRSEELGNIYNNLMAKYFTNEDLKEKFKNSYSPESSRQIIARIYSKPVFGIVPAFTFNGLWSKSSRLREYTLSCACKILEKYTLTVSAGITYDDPTKGMNQESPDRRLTVALTIPFGDFKVSGTYTHHDEDRLRSYAKVQYNPSEIKGLEITVDEYFKPGYANPTATVKYKGEHFDFKVDESVKNIYPKSTIGKKIHNNQQRAYFGTSISSDGFRSYRNSSVNVLRTAFETNKKESEK